MRASEPRARRTNKGHDEKVSMLKSEESAIENSISIPLLDIITLRPRGWRGEGDKRNGKKEGGEVG